MLCQVGFGALDPLQAGADDVEDGALVGVVRVETQTLTCPGAIPVLSAMTLDRG